MNARGSAYQLGPPFCSTYYLGSTTYQGQLRRKAFGSGMLNNAQEMRLSIQKMRNRYVNMVPD